MTLKAGFGFTREKDQNEELGPWPVSTESLMGEEFAAETEGGIVYSSVYSG